MVIVQTEGASTIDPTRIEAALQRLVHSSVLHGSETLCRLLRFLVEQKLEHSDTQVKEYEIATSLLGRPSNFDPRLDPVVRVQVGRLRSKLVEYYATEGTNEDLLIDIPKGSYTPHFLARSRQLAADHNGHAPVLAIPPDAPGAAAAPPPVPATLSRLRVW